MADYFTRFSFIIPLADDQKKYALDIAKIASQSRYEDTQFPPHFPPDLKDAVEDWMFETELCRDGIWLHSEEGGVDSACTFTQHLLQKFQTTAYITFEWSHDCSKPLIDEYGGGAAMITASEIETMTTSAWITSKTT